MTPSRPEDNDEGFPLLQGQDNEAPRASDSNPTPLPTAQIAIVLTAWLAERIAAQSISPYINQVQQTIGHTYLH